MAPEPNLGRWKRAVVHLEAAHDKHYIDMRMQAQRERADLLNRGAITMAEFLRGEEEVLLASPRSRGTALLLDHAGRRVMVTARHVLHPPRAADDDEIYTTVFRVPSLDEISSPGGYERPYVLLNMGDPPPDVRPYTYSRLELDLAVVSLDGPFQERLRLELDALGYEPISTAEIADEPSGEGAQIFTVGFPAAGPFSAPLDGVPSMLLAYASGQVSLPTFSWGRVSMLHEALPFFGGDLSAYPGNSGGPVIEDGHLTGIIVGQGAVPVESEDHGQLDGIAARVPLITIVKAGRLRPLLDAQAEKDEASIPYWETRRRQLLERGRGANG